MTDLDVMGVRFEASSTAPLLLLKEADGTRYLPIWIGVTEAAAITNALEGVVNRRPLTHDLMAQIVATLGDGPVSGRITAVDEGTFFAELVVGQHHIDARPSDLVALALRSGFALSCPPELMDEVGVEVSEASEDEVERFKHFLDHISADDFEEPNP